MPSPSFIACFHYKTCKFICFNRSIHYEFLAWFYGNTITDKELGVICYFIFQRSH